MRVSVKSDIKKLTKGLSKIQKRQIPFAASRALNDVAHSVREDLKDKTPQHIDRPTPFTVRGYRYIKATKRNLTAKVYIDATVYEYLKWQIEGGEKRHDGIGTAVPTSRMKLNKYGNIPGRRKGIIKSKRDFIGDVNGTRVLWREVGAGSNARADIRATFSKRTKYKKILPYYMMAHKRINSQYAKMFAQRIDHALRTAR